MNLISKKLFQVSNCHKRQKHSLCITSNTVKNLEFVQHFSKIFLIQCSLSVRFIQFVYNFLIILLVRCGLFLYKKTECDSSINSHQIIAYLYNFLVFMALQRERVWFYSVLCDVVMRNFDLKQIIFRVNQSKVF